MEVELGDFCINYDDGPVTTINTPRLQSLLAYLALRRAALQSRQHLAFLLWWVFIVNGVAGIADVGLGRLMREWNELDQAHHLLAVT